MEVTFMLGSSSLRKFFLMGMSLGLFVGVAWASEKSFTSEIEAGPAWIAKNDVRIPGAGGTLFSMTDLLGKGPVPTARLELKYHQNRHGWRFLYAPFSAEGTGTLSEETSFAGGTFQPGVDTKGLYKFDTYRLTYRYKLKTAARDDWWIGFTGLVRDAEIKLTQNGESSNKTNVGFAPLLYFYAQRQLAPTWNLIFDFDGLAAPQGRAFDVSLKINKEWNDRWDTSLGYRTLEGGSDNDKVYSFAWINYLMLSVKYRF